jgi:hypothetical protein
VPRAAKANHTTGHVRRNGQGTIRAPAIEALSGVAEAGDEKPNQTNAFAADHKLAYKGA